MDYDLPAGEPSTPLVGVRLPSPQGHCIRTARCISPCGPILAIFGAPRRPISVKLGTPTQPILVDTGAPKRSILVKIGAARGPRLVNFGLPSRPLWAPGRPIFANLGHFWGDPYVVSFQQHAGDMRASPFVLTQSLTKFPFWYP